jgi:hypothetical protein
LSSNGNSYITGGNVGIGVSSLSSWGSNMTALQLPQGVSFYAWNASAVPQLYLGANNYFDGSNFKYTITGQAVSLYYQQGGQHVFYNAPSGTAGNNITLTQAMTLTSGGNLGIGTTSPVSILNLYSSLPVLRWQNPTSGTASNRGADVYLESSDFWIRNIESGKIGFSTGGVEQVRIDNSGAVVFQKFIQLYCSTGSQDGMYIQNTSNNTSANAIIFRGWNASTTGSIATYVNLTTYNTTSDYRLKEDLKQFSGLDLVSKLNMYDFKWKQADWRMYGGLAHEIAEVLPYAVTGIKDGKDNQVVDYSTIVPLLIQSIQEQQAQIRELKQLINK